MTIKILKHKKYILLSILVLVISGLVVFSVDSYNHYQTDKLTQGKEEKQKEKSRQDELDELKEEIESLKNRPSQTIIQNIAPKSSENDKPSLATVIKEWTPRVAQITCRYALLPSQVSTYTKAGISGEPQYGSGSGFLMGIYDQKLKKTVVAIITNYHVLTGHNGFSPADTCTVKIGSYSYEVNGLYAKETRDVKLGIRGIENADDSSLSIENSIEFIDGVPYKTWDPDAGYLIIENPASEIIQLAQEAASCSRKPQIGEEIVVLGFPAIGATKSITATNGIISGVDSRYYVTSAKIEQGNSGGATFWVKESCYIGIPTFALTGEIESLARILDIGYLFR